MKKRVPFFLFVLGLCVTYGSVVFSAPAFGPGEYLDPPCAPGTTYLGDDCTVSAGWEVNQTDGFVFNTTDLIGIGTNTPTVELDVLGGVNFVNTTADSSSSFVHGDVAALGGAGSAGSYSFVSQEVLDINTLGYQLLAIGNTDEVRAKTFVRNGGADLEFNMYTGDGDGGTLGVQTFIELEAGDSNTGSDSYFQLHTDGEIKLNSNPSANINSYINFDDDGQVEIYSNTDVALGVSSGLTFGGPGAFYPGSFNAYAGNASDIQATFTLNPDGLTTMSVDDEDDDGTYGMTLSSDYNTGITISHTDSTLGIVDVGTFYWGGLDAGSGSIRNRVLTSASSNVDFEMNETRLDSSGFHFNYESASGIMSPTSPGVLLVNDTFSFVGSAVTDDIASFQNNDGTCTLDPGDFAWACSSDENLKKDIETLESGLVDILALRPVTYRLRNEDDSVSVTTGLIAQEVEEVLPKLVKHQSDGMLTLNYGGLTPFLVKAIQELDIHIKGIQNFEDETFISRLQDWLASATNGIQNIFSNRIETNEFCVGSVCVNEEEFGEIKDYIINNGGSQSSSGGNDLNDESGDEGESEYSEEILTDEGSGDEIADPVPEPDPQEDVEDVAEEDEEGQPEPSLEPSPEPESAPDEGGGESAPTE
ncbi:MAG: tail fiber domain-containing protein [Candidatus Pacebacteria bacterium]|nr:tail fiber domain-containing protein [Candidatus Paceibacterota bacterium]